MKSKEQGELLGKDTPVAAAPEFGSDPLGLTAAALYRIRNPSAAEPLGGPWVGRFREYWVEAGVIVADLRKAKVVR